MIGVRAFILLQLLLNAASVFLVSVLVLQLTQSRIAAAISAVPPILSVTLTYLALTAMAEPLALLLCAAVILLLARHLCVCSVDSALDVLAALAVAVCIKPSFGACLVFWIIYLAALIARRLIRFDPNQQRGQFRLLYAINAGARKMPLLFLAILPILIQVGFAYGTIGTLGGWSVGPENLDRYFFSLSSGTSRKGVSAPISSTTTIRWLLRPTPAIPRRQTSCTTW